MTAPTEAPASDSLFAAPRVLRERRPDGSSVLRSGDPLQSFDRCVGEWLERWAEQAPDRPFLVERSPQGPWRSLAYREVRTQVHAIATWLLAQRLSPERPVALLSDNGIAHALLALAAMHVGIPVASISVAYSLAGTGHAKLLGILESLRPGLVFASQAAPFGPALTAIAARHDCTIVIGNGLDTDPGQGIGRHAVPFDALLARTDRAAVMQAFKAIIPDTIAKVLFTSGSTGAPKGVINTQRMLCSNQQAKVQVWPFLGTTPPVIVDWLPWSHTFGGNHNFNLVLRNGGTLYIDQGKAAPGLFERTLANLRDVSPTIYFNVPRGYDMLVTALRSDDALRRRFFERLQVIFYAAAALPQHLWDELTQLAVATLGCPVPLVSAWGSTETAPLAADCHFQAERAGVIGVPIPGTELKLVPAAGKHEIRVRGPGVMPGYWRNPTATQAAFDDEGFYRIGDAMKLLDPERPERGLLFDGRIAEDFKLGSGTWVNVGALRLHAVQALAPIAQDVVVCGHERDSVTLLVFADLAACRRIAGLEEPHSRPATRAEVRAADAPAAEDVTAEDVCRAPAVRAHVLAGLARLHAWADGGTSMHATRALLMHEPPSIDAGEITDKGYVNQRAVLERRHAQVTRLHANPADDDVLVLRLPH